MRGCGVDGCGVLWDDARAHLQSSSFLLYSIINFFACHRSLRQILGLIALDEYTATISTPSMPTPLEDPKEYQNIFHWAETQKDGSIPSFATRKNDPYEVGLLCLCYVRSFR